MALGTKAGNDPMVTMTNGLMILKNPEGTIITMVTIETTIATVTAETVAETAIETAIETTIETIIETIIETVIETRDKISWMIRPAKNVKTKTFAITVGSRVITLMNALINRRTLGQRRSTQLV